jgi:hypothetical protein
VSIEILARDVDPARGRSAANGFLARLQRSAPFSDGPMQSPSLRVAGDEIQLTAVYAVSK